MSRPWRLKYGRAAREHRTRTSVEHRYLNLAIYNSAPRIVWLSAGGHWLSRRADFRMLGRQGKASNESITLGVDFKLRNSNICLA